MKKLGKKSVMESNTIHAYAACGNCTCKYRTSPCQCSNSSEGVAKMSYSASAKKYVKQNVESGYRAAFNR